MVVFAWLATTKYSVIVLQDLQEDFVKLTSTSALHSHATMVGLVWTCHRATAVSVLQDTLVFSARMKKASVWKEPALTVPCVRMIQAGHPTSVCVALDTLDQAVISQLILVQRMATPVPIVLAASL